MALIDYLAERPGAPTVIRSATESEAIGRPVGRLTCPIGMDWDAFDPVAAVSAGGCDVTIIRHPSTRARLGFDLQANGIAAWHADTIVYFGADTAGAEPSSRVTLAPADVATTDDFERSLRAVFAGYQNHYRANPLFDEVDVASAYADWALECARSGAAEALDVVDDEGRRVGVVALARPQHGIAEVLLAGIEPEHRRRGHYAEALVSALARSRETGADRLAISTQIGNTAAIGVWCRTGLAPVLAVDTVHAVTASVFHEIGRRR